MIIKSIKLQNFRSHELYSLKMGDKTTQILGENGWGKTSILEAIYIALTGKSFRAVDREIVRRGADFYRIELGLTDGEKVAVAYDLERQNRTFLVKCSKFGRLPKKYKYPVVLFLPDDLHLVSSSPASRRGYFDKFLAQLSPGFSSTLSRYNKALKQRNELLKEASVSPDSLFSWDVMLAKYGCEIRKARKELVQQLNKRLTEVYRGIAKNEDEISISYESYIDDVDESKYLKLLTLDFERDRALGHTNFGVHKDSFEFVFNKSVADGSASRGEVRSLVIALKFIEAEMLEKELGKKPLVLLDDVFSELDEARQEALVSNFKDNQIILTSVG
ncbi:DNA replication and repair protein RecF [Candidatus Saccharibacteria bacterium]|nr:DNA replication and repair protein RecF [Candidatus Saccharibacteria bacterium]